MRKNSNRCLPPSETAPPSRTCAAAQALSLKRLPTFLSPEFLLLMCGRYTNIIPRPVLEKRFEATFAADAAPTYNAAPSQPLPVILNTAPDQIQLLQWGLVPG
jgi:SOS response associated peptidase (SRAP)